MDGTDMLLGIMDNGTFRPLGHSTGCKISFSSETGERTTKEASTAKWKEKYVKSLSCTVTAEGFVYDQDNANDVAASGSTTCEHHGHLALEVSHRIGRQDLRRRLRHHCIGARCACRRRRKVQRDVREHWRCRRDCVLIIRQEDRDESDN